MRTAPHESKTALLDAAMSVIRAKGYTATRIEDVCEAATLTKGSFFHHFKSKEELALAAATRWSTVTSDLFASATYHTLRDPVDRLLGYIDLRQALLNGTLPEVTCLAGTVIQEVYQTHPVIRDAFGESIQNHAATLERDFAEALRTHCVEAPCSANSLALHTQAVIQGAFILAKATGDLRIASESLDHLRRYIQLLFAESKPQARIAPGGKGRRFAGKAR